MLSNSDLNPKTKKQKVKLDGIINRAFSGSKKYFKDRENNRTRFEGYDHSLKTRKEKNQSQYVSPLPATSIEQKASFLTEALTSLGPDFLECSSYDNVEGEDEALVLTRVLSHYLSKANVVEKVYQFNKDLLVYGTGVLRVFWDNQKITQIVKTGPKLSVDPNTGALIQTDGNTKEQIDIVDQPNFENVKINNFWVDPEASSIDTARFVVCRELVSLSKIKSLKQAWKLKNLDLAKKAGIPSRDFGVLGSNRPGRHKNTERTAEYDIDQIIRENYGKNKDNPIMELLTVYRPGTMQLVLNGVPISDEQTIYDEIKYPFIVTRNQPLNGEFYGRSDMDITSSSVMHYEEMNNLIKDNYVEHLRPTTLLDQALGTEAIEDLMRRESGGMVVVPDINGIQELRPTPFDSTAFNYALNYLDEAKTSIAINPMMDGQNPGSGIRSEGSLERFQQVASTRVAVLISMLTFQFENLGKMMIKLVKQFAGDEVIVNVAGKLGEPALLVLRTDRIPHDINVKIRLSHVADTRRATRLAEMQRLIELAANYDQIGIFRLERALVELFIESRAFEDGKELWETDPEVIEARSQLAAQIAGKNQASVPGRNVGPGVQQQLAQAQQQEQFPGGQPQQEEAVQRPVEGNQDGLNQFSN